MGLIMRRLCAIVFIIATASAVDLSRVVEDEDLMFHAEHSKNVWALLRSYQGNRMTAAEVEWLQVNCEKNNVGILWALARMQTEQGIVVNLDGWNYATRMDRCFSYGFGTHSNVFLGYSNQVRYALARMRELADEWTPGKDAPVQGHGRVKSQNLATHGLHRYNWVWSTSANFGVYNVGNSLFVRVLREMQARYRRVTEIK
jgi:hypothetical protein